MSGPATVPIPTDPIADDEIGHLIVVLRRGGLAGGIEALALHLDDEGVAHEVATLLSEFGPTWLIQLYEADSKRYRPGCVECQEPLR